MEDKYKNLYQLHQQEREYPYKIVEVIAQKEIETEKEMREWQKDVNKRHPLPEGTRWVILNWDHENFVKTTEEAMSREVVLT